MKITKEVNLGELVGTYPAVAKFLYDEYGLHCVNCIANSFDTLEAGMKLHRYTDDDILEAANAVNEFIAKQKQ